MKGRSCGDFIQEGADNIDLNTETIDRKNTMHSMARAIFQVVQDHTPTSEIISTKIKRGQDRSLSSKTVSLQGKKHKYQMHEGFQLND
jgi:dTDP-4-dehydrorhamnose reductase